MFTKTIKASQLTKPNDPCNIALGDVITYIERGEVKKGEVTACYEGGKKFEVDY